MISNEIVLKNLYDGLKERINADILVKYEDTFDEIHVSIKHNSLNWGYLVRGYDVYIYGYNYLVDSIVRRYKDFILSYYFKVKEVK